MTKVLSKLAIFILLLNLVSCSSLKNHYQAPIVKVEKVSLANMSFTGVDLNVLLEVENTNSVQINIDQLNYSLELDGRPASLGHIKESIKIKSKGKSTINIPINLKLKDLLSSALTLTTQSSGLPYKVHGSAKIGVFNVPFTKSGLIQLPMP